MPRGRKGEGYYVFTCSGKFLKECDSISSAAKMLGFNTKSVHTSVYQDTSIRGYVVMKKADKPSTIKETLKVCRQRDRRWIVANSDKTKAKYFSYRHECRTYAEENGWEDPYILRARDVERTLPEELYIKAEGFMSLEY